ncbi:hypothetical protein PTTG_31125, partial [Puccinia triticina 1-1 BBBD Race 1]
MPFGDHPRLAESQKGKRKLTSDITEAPAAERPSKQTRQAPVAGGCSRMAPTERKSSQIRASTDPNSQPSPHAHSDTSSTHSYALRQRKKMSYTTSDDHKSSESEEEGGSDDT